MSNSQGAQSPEPDSWTWINWSQHLVSTCVSSLKIGWKKHTHTQTNKSFLATKSFRCYCEASLIYSNGQTESIMIHRQAAEISTSVQPGTPSSFSDWKRVEAGELGDWWWWRWWGWECVYRCREWKCPCEMEILRVREKAESTRETELNHDL